MIQANPGIGIVGAGPVGLATALFLASHGVPSTVLEAAPTLIKQGSKACTIQGDVLEILERVGCGEALASEGIPWHVARTYVRGRLLYSTVYPLGPGFPPYLNISQHRTQQVMLERVAERGLVDVRWSHRAVGVSQDGSIVTVDVETPGGMRQLRFAYLVAADGIHSPLRHLTGMPWTGYSHGDRFLSTDIRAVLPFAHERHFHYDHPANPGRQVVMHAQPGNLWRIDWQLPADTDIEAEQRTDRFDRRVRATLGDVDYEIDWLSTYRFNQRVVERMRLGRILFAGDAAHALPPYGARGMNSGIQDADNLAWKLAMVVRGRAGEDLLETYHVERHAAARENLRVTEATIRFMVPPGRLRHWARDTLLRLAPQLKILRARVNSGRMAEPYVYVESPVVDTGYDPLLGRFAPDGVVSRAGRPARLRQLLGGEFVWLCFGAAGQVPEGRVCLVLPAGAGPGETPPDTVVVHDESGALEAAYPGPRPRWYLVRPDGHIAAAGAGPVADPAGVVARCSGGAPALLPATAVQGGS